MSGFSESEGFDDGIAFCNEHGDWHPRETADPTCDFDLS